MGRPSYLKDTKEDLVYTEIKYIGGWSCRIDGRSFVGILLNYYIEQILLKGIDKIVNDFYCIYLYCIIW